MKGVTMLLGVFILVITMVVASAALESYQVTGPVLEVKDNSLIVQKGKEKWEIAKDKDTKVTGEVKVGSKVTVHYQMKATTIEVKEEGKKETKKK
jgi:hypothetical protein